MQATVLYFKVHLLGLWKAKCSFTVILLGFYTQCQKYILLYKQKSCLQQIYQRGRILKSKTRFSQNVYTHKDHNTLWNAEKQITAINKKLKTANALK